MIPTTGWGSTVLFLSPHLDDVAFSCGGTLAAMRRGGWRVALATVFTASRPRPSGFALACQLDKGLGPEVNYMALRRAEDEAFARVVGVDDHTWLDLPEAPHRGYGSARELFERPRPDDSIVEVASRAIGGLIDRLQPDLILAPQAVGGHVDHRQVVRSILGFSDRVDRLAWYRDLPYAEKFPEARADPALPEELVEVALELEPADLRAKLDGCCCYTTQVPFQFGDEATLRSRLSSFATREASRAGLPGQVETFLMSPSLLARHLKEPILGGGASFSPTSRANLPG